VELKNHVAVNIRRDWVSIVDVDRILGDGLRQSATESSRASSVEIAAHSGSEYSRRQRDTWMADLRWDGSGD
jgi:hypothetical protein